MKASVVFISALTAFIITAGGAISAVIGSGYRLNWPAMVVAAVFGLVAAAKDTRSLLRLPPVQNGNGSEPRGPDKPPVSSPKD